MSVLIDKFQQSVTMHFRELVLATAYLQIGEQATKRSPPTASVALNLAEGLTTEPMFLSELQAHSTTVILGVAELFQTKVVAAWADLLNGLFEQFVLMHMNGEGNYPEFKKRTTRIDFSSSDDVLTQMRMGLVADFAFAKYSERIQTIGRVLVANEAVSRALQLVKKHVSIRNAAQHHSGLVYEEMLRELGSNTVEVLDEAGQVCSLNLGDAIALHVPELNRFKGAIFIITNEWRSQLGTHTNGSDT